MEHIVSPTHIRAVGNLPKIIKEFVGWVNTNSGEVSIAKMESPSGWTEPGQTPEFDEYTIVLRGMVQVKTKRKTFEVRAGEVFIAHKGDWVQYSTPGEGAEYIAVCLPAFSPKIVHRDL